MLPKTSTGRRSAYQLHHRRRPKPTLSFVDTEAVNYRAVRPDVAQGKNSLSNFADGPSAAETGAEKTVRKKVLF